MQIVQTAVLPMFLLPDRGSERVSEALFGEAVQIAEQSGDWVRIRTPDGYSGWAEAHGLAERTAYPGAERAYRVMSAAAEITEEPGWIPLGCLVEAEVGEEGWLRLFLPSGREARANSADFQSASVSPSFEAESLVAMARWFHGAPYVWGGRTPRGTDCSGFVQRVYAIHGVFIPRDAYLQAMWDGFEPVERGSLQPGDLVFFLGESDPRGRGITHVGLAIGGNQMIHAVKPLGVAETPFDSPPYDRQFVCARRLRSSCRLR